MTCTVRGISIDPGDRRSSIDKDGEREYVVVYKVTSNDKRDGAGQARIAFGIPSVGDLYIAGNDNDISAVVIGKDAYQGDSPFEWLVEIRYSTDLGLKPPQQYNTPLDEPAEVTFGFQERRILVPGYYNNPGTPNVNGDFELGVLASNGEQFDPQPEVDIADPILSIRKNVADGAFTFASLMQLANCVNSDTWQNATPRQLRFLPPTASRKYHRIIGYYWELSYAIAYRWETWDIQVLNQGTYYWTGGKPPVVSNTTKWPVPFKSIGLPIIGNLAANGDRNITSTPTFTRIRFRREIAFGSLNLFP